MSTGKETVCSLCHGEIGPDVDGRVMCYGCGPDERLPPERRKLKTQARKPCDEKRASPEV